jgi:G-protein alpha subunit
VPFFVHYRLSQEQNLDSIIFVVSIGNFDQNMIENAQIGRFYDSLSCFETLMGNTLLKKVPIIILFNKVCLTVTLVRP